MSTVSSSTSSDEIVFSWTFRDILLQSDDEPITSTTFTLTSTLDDSPLWKLLVTKSVYNQSLVVVLSDARLNLDIKVNLNADFRFDLAVVDVNGRVKLKAPGQTYATHQSTLFGWVPFVSLDQLRDARCGLLVEGKHLKLQLIRVRETATPSASTSSAVAAQPMMQQKLFENIFKWQPFNMDILQHCDIKLLVGEQLETIETFEAHKFILASRSPFFANMFKDKQQNKVRLREIEPDVFKEVLRFIYNGQVDRLDEISDKLILAADLFQIGNLKDACAARLIKNLSFNNCLEVFKIADKTNVSVLKLPTIKFIVENRSQIDDAELKSLFNKHQDLAFELWNYACSRLRVETRKRPNE